MYAILLNEQQELDLEKTAHILAKADNLVYADATRAVRTCTGVLAKNLPYDEAQRIADELSANGVGCFILAMNEFYTPPDARSLTNLDLSPTAFGAIDIYGRVQPVPWDLIVLLSLGRLGEQRRERYTFGEHAAGDAALAVGVAVGFGVAGAVRRAAQEPQKTEVREDAKYVLDLFARQPNEGHWRIEHNGMGYACLGARVTQLAEDNFRMVVEDIVRYATQCFGNRGLNAFLEGAPPRTYTYEGIKQFDEENLWLLQKVYLNLRAQ
jgi:hypothetical protein